MVEYNRRIADHGYLPSQSPIKDDLQQLYARNTSQTEEIIETLRGVNDTQLMILSELQTLEHLSAKTNSTSEVTDQTKEHLEKIAKIIYTTNGYDEKGNKVPEGVLRFERWTNFLSQAFWNFVTAGIISTVFYYYVEAQRVAQQNQSKADVEILQKMETRLAERDQKIERLTQRSLEKK